MLGSDAAIQSIKTHTYWPKWDSPWWHMSVLFEMGLAHQIPAQASNLMLSEVARTHLPIFLNAEIPPILKEYEEIPCPCSLGNLYQILSAAGLDVDAALPWARAWFLRYQMPDGGLNCDPAAYHGEPDASSMVATIAALEAILSVRGELTIDEESFLDKGAQFLIDRQLRLGSASQFNAEEKDDEEDWLKLCFPRFYFYDVLRGLSILLKWSDRRKRPLPKGAIKFVVQHLKSAVSQGQLNIERLSFEGARTRIRSEAGDWNQRVPASSFSLLEQVSKLGQPSSFLSQQWDECLIYIKHDAVLNPG